MISNFTCNFAESKSGLLMARSAKVLDEGAQKTIDIGIIPWLMLFNLSS